MASTSKRHYLCCWSFLVLGFLFCCCGKSQTLPLVMIPANTNTSIETNITLLDSSNDLPRKAYLIRTTQPWSVITPLRGNHLVRTSIQARENHCMLATNGGPFNRDGSPVGVVIVNGTVIADDHGVDDVGFGISKFDSHQQRLWVIGTIDASENHHHGHGSSSSSSPPRIDDLEFYVTGFDWLVLDGMNVASFRNNTTGAKQAPRTAIGVDGDGRLMLLVSDGCAKCLRRKGLTLTQLADILIRYGAQYAINLDGGGSSVMIGKNGNIYSRPTCIDIPCICERPVSTVICIKKKTALKYLSTMPPCLPEA